MRRAEGTLKYFVLLKSFIFPPPPLVFFLTIAKYNSSFCNFKLVCFVSFGVYFVYSDDSGLER